MRPSSTNSSSPTRATRSNERARRSAARLADVVVNCVNVPGTELASILCARDGGTVYFFSMATSFTAAALGAEGVGSDVTMIVGNGIPMVMPRSRCKRCAIIPNSTPFTQTYARTTPMTQTLTIQHPHEKPPVGPDYFDYKNLKQGEFWRHIPAYAEIDEARSSIISGNSGNR